MTMAFPKSGRRSDMPKPAGRRALEAPFERAHEASIEVRMGKGIMPGDGLPRERRLQPLLRWYSDGWDIEVPTAIHKSEVWRDFGTEGQGGSKLGAPAHTDPFRRYLENASSETDVDGYFIRPMHAALTRMSRRWPLTARSLFAVAQSGYDWRGVGVRGGWAEEMFQGFLITALEQLWAEYREDVVRLT